MKSISIFTDHSLIYGYEVVYVNPMNGADLVVGHHIGKHTNQAVHRETVNFEICEYLQGFSIRSGDVVDRVEFVTNYGRSFGFGGFGGSHKTILDRTAGKRIVAIGGGCGGHMHNFKVWYI